MREAIKRKAKEWLITKILDHAGDDRDDRIRVIIELIRVLCEYAEIDDREPCTCSSIKCRLASAAIRFNDIYGSELSGYRNIN